MAKKIVTVYIDDTSIRLLVARGRRVRKWASTQLEPGLVRGSVITDEAAVAAKVRQLFHDNKVRAKKVVVGLSGLHCLTRPAILPALPKAMLAEAVKHEARRVLPVPPEQLYLSWQSLPSAGGKCCLFIVAIPRRIADVLIRTLRRARLRPYHLDIKPLALARLVKEPTAIIVDVHPCDFDITLMVNGIPQPLRTVPLPSGEMSPEARQDRIKDELDRTIQFYNSNNTDNQIGPDVPLYVSGEAADDPTMRQYLQQSFPNPLSPLTSPLAHPEPFNSGSLGVNVSLALKELQSRRGRGSLIGDLNCVPGPYLPPPFSITRVVILPIGVIVLGVLGLQAMYVQDVSASIISLQSQVNNTEFAVTRRQEQKKAVETSIKEYEKNLSKLQSGSKLFAAARESLDSQTELMNDQLAIVVRNLPGSVYITKIDATVSQIRLEAWSPDEKDMILYARQLQQSGRFAPITITRVGADSVHVSFVLLLKTKAE